MTTAADTIPVPEWASYTGIVARYDGDLRRLGNSVLGTGSSDYPSMFGVLLAEEPDDDQLDYLLAVVGYAFRPHMYGLPAIDSGPGISVHNQLVMAYAPFAQRGSRTRTVDEAFTEMVEMIRMMYREGSPARADGSRLIATCRPPRPVRRRPSTGSISRPCSVAYPLREANPPRRARRIRTVRRSPPATPLPVCTPVEAERPRAPARAPNIAAWRSELPRRTATRPPL
jgi:hypothetical protein